MPETAKRKGVRSINRESQWKIMFDQALREIIELSSGTSRTI